VSRIFSVIIQPHRRIKFISETFTELTNAFVIVEISTSRRRAPYLRTITKALEKSKEKFTERTETNSHARGRPYTYT
jgi:hypothetical protein